MHFAIVVFVFWTTAKFAQCNMDILLFGGNGFIGGHTSERLIADGHKLTLINRNNWPWDLSETVKRKVFSTVTLDRSTDEGLEIFKEKLLSPRKGVPFDVIIDFSAYKLKNFEPFYEELKNFCKLYIYISTDSVYEVCDRSVVGGGELLDETHSRRPSDEKISDELNKKDSYGHKKLQIEEYLIAQRSNGSGCPYLILRLPDVLGERDSTQRWWKYQMWLEYTNYLQRPVLIPNVVRNLKTSYVYVKDIARFLASVILKTDQVKDQVFNFAFDEPKYLRELLLHMKQSARLVRNIENSNNSDENEDIFYFPSVTRGGINVKHLFDSFSDFQFTPWDTMVHKIVDFYEKAFLNFPRERDAVAYSLCRDLNMNNDQCQKFTTHLLLGSVL